VEEVVKREENKKGYEIFLHFLIIKLQTDVVKFMALSTLEETSLKAHESPAVRLNLTR
jgi:hypothetical protein